LTLEQCIDVFSSRFDLEARVPVPHSGRTLLLWRRKES
jgi:hypothetical protein